MKTTQPSLVPVVTLIASLRVSPPLPAPHPPSLRATVHVRVNDVNEFSPVFVERRYEASVPEGRLFDRIVRVEALDADCSPQYSQICFYDIITPNVPFAIDNDGERTSIMFSLITNCYSPVYTYFVCNRCAYYFPHFMFGLESIDCV